MKIVLINPSSVLFDSYKNYADFLSKKSNYTTRMPPLGLLYLNQILNNEGHQSIIIDQASSGGSLNSILKTIKKIDPNLVGISVLSNSSQAANKLANSIKNLNPNLKIVFGNCHATIWSRRILENHKMIDYCIRGEGEYSFLDLVNALEEDKSLENISGLTYRENNRIIENDETPLIENLDDLPFPERTKLNIEYNNDFGGIRFAVGKFTTMLSSRGCPFRCNYCINSLLGRHNWRSRSVKNIIEELLYLEEKKYKEVLFIDDNFTLKRNRVIQICREIKREKIDIIFSGIGRVDQDAGNIFKIMVNQGNFKFISFGIESGSQKTLDYFNKQITPQQARDTIKLARKANFDFVMANFMVGAPHETIDDVFQTLKFILTSDITWPIISIVQAIPKTKMWFDLQNLQSINIDQFWETGVPVVDLNILDYSRETLMNLIKNTYSQFASLKRFNFWVKEFLTSLIKPYKFKMVINIIKNLNMLPKIYSKTPDALNA